MTAPAPGSIVRLRASALSDLFDDALRWKVRALDGLSTPRYGRSHLGSAIHFGTAAFDRERLVVNGQAGTPDAGVAVAKFREYFHNDDDVHWIDIKKAEAEKIGIRLVADYCVEISPQFEFVAVEQECEPLELEMEEEGITLQLTGTDDRIYTRDGRYGIMDFKSGYGVIGRDGEVQVAKHGPQLAEYELLEAMATRATQLPITLPAIVVALSTETGKVQWKEIENTRRLLFGDGEHMGYLKAAAKIIAGGLFVGNPRSMLCTERYCPIYDSCFYRIGRES